MGLTTRPRGGRGCAAAAPVVVGPFLPCGGPVSQWPPTATVLPALLKGGAALPQPKWDGLLWTHRSLPTMPQESSMLACERSSVLPVPRPVVFPFSERRVSRGHALPFASPFSKKTGCFSRLCEVLVSKCLYELVRIGPVSLAFIYLFIYF